jgi:hypothetical protein
MPGRRRSPADRMPKELVIAIGRGCLRLRRGRVCGDGASPPASTAVPRRGVYSGIARIRRSPLSNRRHSRGTAGSSDRPNRLLGGFVRVRARRVAGRRQRPAVLGQTRGLRITTWRTNPSEQEIADAPGRIRTCDPRIRSPPLCPLSYGRVCGGYRRGLPFSAAGRYAVAASRWR